MYFEQFFLQSGFCKLNFQNEISQIHKLSLHILFSLVVMYTSVTILTALAILLQIISSNLVYEERLYSPPRILFKFFFDHANPILKLDVYKLQVCT